MALRFVHAADLHLDSPLGGLGGWPKAPEIIRRATFEAFSRIVSLCIQERVDFLALAGDLFDQKDRSVRARVFLADQLARLEQAGVRVFVVHGNHDPLSTGKGLVLPPSVKVFGGDWEEVPLLDARGQVRCRIQGVSYPQEAVRENLAKRFVRRGPELTVGLLHTNVGSHSGHANYAPCTASDLAAAGLDYWALGHVHTRAELLLDSGGVAVYPGNPQGRHVRELGPRGCMLVEVEGRRSERRFVPLDPVRWLKLELDLAELEALEQLVPHAEERVGEALDGVGQGPWPVQAFAVRLVLSGRGPLHRELRQPGALAACEEALREKLLLHRPAVVLEGLQDASSPNLDLEAIAVSGGLPATVLALARQSSDPRLVEELLLEEDVARLDAALRRAELPGLSERGAELLSAAALRAVALLLEEGSL